MQSNSKIALVGTLLLAGCAGGGSYGAAPRLADPSFDTPLALSAATPPVENAVPVDPALPSDIVAPAMPQDGAPPVSGGPRATSGETRYDAVGYADIGGSAAGGGTTISHATLPVGSFVELTALASGKTIIAEVSEQGYADGGALAVLSPATAAALGVAEERVPVRIRLTSPSPQDRMAVKSGSVASRIDAPPALLVALRKRLGSPAPAVAAVIPARRATTPGVAYRLPAERAPARVAARSGPGLFVQIAALSDVARARSLASGMDGRVVSGGGFHRVQIGPYADQKMAQQARDGAARRGYGDARIVKAN